MSAKETREILLDAAPMVLFALASTVPMLRALRLGLKLTAIALIVVQKRSRRGSGVLAGA